MKWFFLSFFPLLAVVGNAVLLSEVTVLRALGVGAFNLFIASLASAWWHAYYATSHRRAQGLIISHAIFMLSLGLAVALVGAGLAVSGSCEALISSSHLPSLRSRLASQAQALGYCRPVGFALVALGIVLALPSVRLFTDLRRGA